MAQYCTNNQLNILNLIDGIDEDHNNEHSSLNLISLPLVHNIHPEALLIIKEQANIPSNWSPDRVTNWLGIHNKITWVSNGFIMLPVFVNLSQDLHFEENNHIVIRITLDQIIASSQRDLLNVAFPNNPTENIIEYVNRAPINLANLYQVTFRIPRYVEDC